MICKDIKSKYLPEIDFWKFVFSILIVFSHGIFLADTENGDKLLFGNALMGVEFYFLVTGFFLVNSIYKKNDSTFAFVKKRVLNLLPYFVYSFIFCFAVWLVDQIVFQHLNKWPLLAKSLNGIWEFLWMESSGVATAGINGTWWFLSAMLFAEWVLYPIIRKRERLFVSYLGPLSIFLLVGFFSRTYGTLAAGKMFGMINSDNLRAILGVVAGALLFYATYSVQRIQLKPKIKAVLTVIEWLGFLLIWVIAYKNTETVSYYVDRNLQLISIPVMFVSIGVITSGNSLTNRVFPSKICKTLGRFSTCVYMVHWQCMVLIKRLAPAEMGYHMKLVLLFVLSFLVAVLVMILAEKSVLFFRSHKDSLMKKVCVVTE